MTSQVAFHTNRPESSPIWLQKQPPYRNILGITSGDTELWVPGSGGAGIKSEVWELPEEFAHNVVAYFDKHHVREPNLDRNCHLGAAIMSSGNMVTVENAEDDALEMIQEKNIIAPAHLPVGKWGVLGLTLNGGIPHIIHSVVSLGEYSDVCLQVDGWNGPMSIGSYANNLAHYQRFFCTSLKLYTTRAE